MCHHILFSPVKKKNESVCQQFGTLTYCIVCKNSSQEHLLMWLINIEKSLIPMVTIFFFSLWKTLCPYNWQIWIFRLTAMRLLKHTSIKCHFFIKRSNFQLNFGVDFKLVKKIIKLMSFFKKRNNKKWPTSESKVKWSDKDQNLEPVAVVSCQDEYEMLLRILHNICLHCCGNNDVTHFMFQSNLKLASTL